MKKSCLKHLPVHHHLKIFVHLKEYESKFITKKEMAARYIRHGEKATLNIPNMATGVPGEDVMVLPGVPLDTASAQPPGQRRWGGEVLHGMTSSQVSKPDIAWYKKLHQSMTSLSYGRIFCLESQKIDSTEYLRGSKDFAIFFYIIEPRSLKFGRRI